MMVKWGEEYQKLHPGVQFDISAGGAGKGMTDALGGQVDIGMVSREIKPEEEKQGAYWVSVVKDAVFPAVNEKNPVWHDLLSQGRLAREIHRHLHHRQDQDVGRVGRPAGDHRRDSCLHPIGCGGCAGDVGQVSGQ